MQHVIIVMILDLINDNINNNQRFIIFKLAFFLRFDYPAIK